MASSPYEAILAEIERILTLNPNDSASASTGNVMNTQVRARAVLDLAEAHAWLLDRSQPHGNR